MIVAVWKTVSIGCAPRFARTQAFQSRTVRLITNVELFATARDDAPMLPSNFLISEFCRAQWRLLEDRSQSGESARMRQTIRNLSIIL
jgi:hypothetical protein